MKIGRELARSLEADISILELDNALNDTRTRTAAGPDGINNSFKKKNFGALLGYLCINTLTFA